MEVSTGPGILVGDLGFDVDADGDEDEDGSAAAAAVVEEDDMVRRDDRKGCDGLMTIARAGRYAARDNERAPKIDREGGICRSAFGSDLTLFVCLSVYCRQEPKSMCYEVWSIWNSR